MAAVRFISLYYNQKKVGETNNQTLKINGNDTRMYGDAAILAMAEGIIECDLDATFTFPTTGVSVPVLEDLLAKKDFTMGMLLGTKLFSVPMRATTGSLKTQSKSGETTLDVTALSSGPPKLVG